MKQIIVVLLLASSPFIYAETLTLHGENGLWIVEAFDRAADGWPERLWHKSYTSEKLAMAQMRSSTPPKPIELKRPLNVAPLWIVTQTWSWEWEQRYADWILQNVDPGFLAQYGIATDCADAAYALRWIFARINGLPAANHLAGTGDLLTQDSVRPIWQNLPTATNWWEDQRFLAALNYLLDYTYTHTLMADSYPIEISQEALLAGTHHLNLHQVSGHTTLVHRTYYSDPTQIPFKVLYSTTPRNVKSLAESYYWYQEQPVPGQGGFLHMRWPEQSSSGTVLVPTANMPFYSEMQYDPNFMGQETSFNLAVFKKLAPNFSLETLLQNAIGDLKALILSRQTVVEDGFAYCQSHDCSPGSQGYEDWSTPNRDQRVLDLKDQIRDIVRLNQPHLFRLWASAGQTTALSLSGIDYNLSHVLSIFDHGLTSSDPNVSVARRWALASSSFVEAMTEKLSDVLSARDAKIAASPCRSTSCPFDSEEWQNWSTQYEDEVLVQLRTYDRNYCTTAPVAECISYKTIRSTQMATFKNETLSLPEWLNRVLWYNWDPGQPVDVRWGSLSSYYNSQAFPSWYTLQVAQSGWTVARTEDESVLMNLSTHAKIDAPASFTWQALSEDGNWAVASSINEIYFFNTSNQQSWNLSIPGVAKAVFFDTGKIALLDNTGTLTLVDFTAQPRIISQLTDITDIKQCQVKGTLIVGDNQKLVALIDSTGRRFNTTASSDINWYLYDTLYESSHFWFMRTWSTSSEKTEIWAINKNNGQVTARPELKELRTWIKGSGKALLYDDRALLVRVDEDLNTLEAPTDIGRHAQAQPPYLCATSDQLTTRCYAYDGNTLGTNPIPMPYPLREWNTQFRVWADPNGGERLTTTADPSQPLIQAPYIDLFGNNWILATGENFNDQNRLFDGEHLERGHVFNTEVSRMSFAVPNAILRGDVLIPMSQEALWLERR